ncbi:RNA-directed DNA polymerase, eukaryota, partial [Tanacetum coccineum]
SDFCSAVDCFFESGTFPNGCNSSFIALIPKVTDAKFITDCHPISLIGSVYKVVSKILAKRLAVVISEIVSNTQSAFIANRQILDGPFILNEVFFWCKRKKKQALVFKVDFAKVYDSVRWDFLLDVLHAFGFGPRWCMWIRGMLYSAKASILINGSPTAEFQFFCGLKQGDPLAPFLFNLVMESLHFSVSREVIDGIFKGLRLNGSLSISHLFYADDAVFIGEWSDANLINLIRILNCFHLASGLKINVKKSQVIGVGVPPDIVNQGALLIGCAVLQTPFKYLGVMVGDHMSRYSAWSSTIQNVHARLSKCKVKTLSIGGRLTLLKSVLGVVPLYTLSIYKAPVGVLYEMEMIRNKFFNGANSLEKKITWIAWDKVLASKKKGGLGVSSVHALNRALLFKWVWRFLSQDGSLWSQVISAMYGSLLDSHSLNISSIWCHILCEVQSLTLKESVQDSSVAAKWVANSFDASFRRQIRDGVERHQWLELLSLLSSFALSPSTDRWVCDLCGDGEFRVKEIRSAIDDLLLPSVGAVTRWVKHIPIKGNIFAWQARFDRLPTRGNLVTRGVALDSPLCPVCNLVPEDIQHVLFRVFFILLGGSFGPFGITLFLMILFRGAPFSLMTLSRALLIGVLIVVLTLFLGRLG